jgi:hypothetical protein
MIEIRLFRTEGENFNNIPYKDENLTDFRLLFFIVAKRLYYEFG